MTFEEDYKTVHEHTDTHRINKKFMEEAVAKMQQQVKELKVSAKPEPSDTFKKQLTIGLVSGGFDPMHKGHVAYLKEAAQLCDQLYVVVNSDEWLRTKKGYCLVPQDSRLEIVKNFPFVYAAYISDTLSDVSQDILKIKPNFFFNGGDRNDKTCVTAEVEMCDRLGVKILYGIGGTDKAESSSNLFHKAVNEYNQFIMSIAQPVILPTIFPTSPPLYPPMTDNPFTWNISWNAPVSS